MSKITKATFKSFIRKNEGKLFINVKSTFDGMIDGCRSVHTGFLRAQRTEDTYKNEHNLGYEGIWLVGGSRDYFDPYEDEDFTGIKCFNCCGHFIVAIKKEK